MKMKDLIASITLAASVCAFSAANAASVDNTLAYDEFLYNGKNVANWDEYERKKKSVRSKNGKAFLTGEQKGKVDAAMSTGALALQPTFKQVEISFDYKAKKANKKNKLFVAYTYDMSADMSDKSAWTNVAKLNGKKGSKSASLTMDLADGAENIKFMVWTKVKGKKKNEGFMLNNFYVIGTPPPTTLFDSEGPYNLPDYGDEYIASAPLPAGLPLLLAGVGGLAYMRKRGRKS
ncbi:MAG: VPLPA-CTERM sorting domain-containing protein [Pseudomonadota bacterium]